MTAQEPRNLGIDIGATNTLVAQIKNGRPEIIEIDNASMVPSMIYLERQGGNPIVGQVAQDMWADRDYDAANSFRGWKSLVGRNVTLAAIQPGGPTSDPVAVTPEYLTTLMVEYALRQVSQNLGGEPFDSVLVTVPHGWRRQDPHRCRATRQAAERATVNGQPVRVQGQTVSEPVAAAAYWIWEYNQHRQRVDGAKAPDLVGKHVMVCDVGGSTTDLSLIRVGGEDRPLEVVAAANNDCAGDYTDALICAHICECFNKQFAAEYESAYGAQLPTTAEAVLEETAARQPRFPWLRKWLLEAQRLKHDICTKIERLRPPTPIRPTRMDFTDADGRHLQIEMTPDLLYTCLEPFYQAGRTLVEAFMRAGQRPAPHAVVFCGGGSRIAGVRERMVVQALGRLYTPELATTVADRIPVNPNKVDKAIALGAALIANGIVSVQERLLHDIGIRTEIRHRQVSDLLHLPADNQTFVLAPVLKEHEALPANVTNKALGIRAAAPPDGEQFLVSVVIYDDPQAPWIQVWEVPHPGSNRSIEWRLHVDTEGELRIEVHMADGAWEQSCTLQRERKGRISNMLMGPEEQDDTEQLPRITPEQLKEAIDKTNTQPKSQSDSQQTGSQAKIRANHQTKSRGNNQQTDNQTNSKDGKAG